MEDVLDWTDLRYFLGVARTGSLTRTALELRVSQSTVSRRIAALEESLGVSLFARHQTGYFLTDQGRSVMEHAEAVEERVFGLERAVSGLDGSATGTVRLATAETLATHLLIPALPALAQRHPELRLEIVTGTAQVSLSRHEADLALRLVRPEGGNLTLRRIGAMAHAVYGSKSYLQAHPTPVDAPFAGRSAILWDDPHAHLPAAKWLARAWPDAPVAITLSSLAAQLTAARTGLGLAVLPRFLAANAPELVEVVPPANALSEDLWLVTHADLVHSARARAAAEFIVKTVAEASALL